MGTEHWEGSLTSSSGADKGVWINLIRGREEQSASVREAPVESSTLIKTVSPHTGRSVCVCVCVTKLLKWIKSIKAIKMCTKLFYCLCCSHI